MLSCHTIIVSYESAGTHRHEVPRMFLSSGNHLALPAYIIHSNDPYVIHSLFTIHNTFSISV